MPGPRLRPSRPQAPEFTIAEHAAARGFDVEIARLIIGERPDLRTLGRFRSGQWMYSGAAAERIAHAIAERRAR